MKRIPYRQSLEGWTERMSELGGADTDDQVSAKAEDWDTLGIGIAVVDRDQRLLRANRTATALLAVNSPSVTGQVIHTLVDPVDAAPVRMCIDSAIATGTETTIRLPSVTGDGDVLWRMRLHAPNEVLLCLEHTSELLPGDRLRDAMQTLLDNHQGFVGIADDRADVIYLNDRAREILGVSPEEVSGLRLTEVLHAETFNRYYEEIRPTLLEHGRWSGVVRLAAPDAPEEMWGTVYAGVGPSGDTIEWLAAVTEADATSIEAVELAHRANHDHLTGLANRSLFLDRLRLALLRRDKARHPVTVAFLDLDGFKAVNDAEGHHIGDELLRQVAERLTNLMRPTDTVARWGGDEFVILFEDGAQDSGLTERLAGGIGEEPFEVKGTDYHLGATVGTTTSPPGPATAEELVAAADAAMYRSKRSNGEPAKP